LLKKSNLKDGEIKPEIILYEYNDSFYCFYMRRYSMPDKRHIALLRSGFGACMFLYNGIEHGIQGERIDGNDF
jgi:hypothetical protein